MFSTRLKKRNESFTCLNCGKEVPKAKKMSRNHCPFCLYSRHVDIVPGDRQELCKGLMEPVNYEYKSGVFTILHKCIKCGKVQKNTAAADDDVDQLFK